MRLITEDGKEFHCHFWHHPVVGHRRRRPHLRTEVRLHAGACALDKDKHCTKEAVHAIATQNSKLDVFDKKVGRVIALDRALRGVPERTVTGRIIWPKPLLPREVRAQVWASYHAQARLPKSRAR